MTTLNLEVAKFNFFPFTPSNPSRAVELPDGTVVNPTGFAKYKGDAKDLSKKVLYKITEIRVGVESGIVFLGLIFEDYLYFLPASDFKLGILGADPLNLWSIPCQES